VALTATVPVAQNSGPRQRPRLAASSGSQTKAPGSAGGYLLPSWRLGQRDLATAKDFVNDLAQRVKGRVQVTTDALRTYVNVIEDAERRSIMPNCIRSIALRWKMRRATVRQSVSAA
jgi:transposase-like protein